MKRWTIYCSLCLALVLVSVPSIAQSKGSANSSEQDNTNTWSPERTANIVKEVRHKLSSMTDYDVFDSIRFAL